MVEKVSGVQVFWTIIAALIYVWASGWFVISHRRWAENVIRDINKTRPADDQFPVDYQFPAWGFVSPFRQWELQEAMWQHDPRGFKKMLLKLAAVMLLGVALMLLGVGVMLLGVALPILANG